MNIESDIIVASQLYSLEYKFSVNEQSIWNIDRELNIKDLSVDDYIYVLCKITNKTEMAKVKSIENDIITVDISHFIMYELLSENAKMFDKNNNYTSIFDMNMGDSIHIDDGLKNTPNFATIQYIKNNIIIADAQPTKWYSLNIVDNIIVCNDAKNSVEISNLKVGDILDVICNRKIISNLMAGNFEYLDSVQSIKIIYKNLI